MTQEQVRQLARKFLDGNATDEEKRLLHEWYDRENPEHAEPELVANLETAEELKERMRANLRRMQEPAPSRNYISIVRRITAWSTSIAAAVIIGFIFWSKSPEPVRKSVNLVHAPLGRTLEVKLPDGSSVWLNAGSTLSYPDSFSTKNREVILKEGQAFFDIVHLAHKPFIVHAKTLDITVLGTSFDVKAYENDADIKVTVKTGKVGVTIRDKPETPALMLLPAEQAVVEEKDTKIRVSEISRPAIAPWKDNQLVFEDELLSEVFRVLERKYNQHILVENENLSAEKISLTLDNQPMTDVLKVLSFSKKFNYSQLNDSTIVIR